MSFIVKTVDFNQTPWDGTGVKPEVTEDVSFMVFDETGRKYGGTVAWTKDFKKATRFTSSGYAEAAIGEAIQLYGKKYTIDSFVVFEEDSL